MHEFSPAGYEHVLASAERFGFTVAPLSERKTAEPDDRTLYLRHDVDADLDASVAMARLEQALGIRSTYLFMVRSPVYNLFSRYARTAVEAVLQAGHTVGIHFDAHGFTREPDVRLSLQREARMLAEEFSTDIDCVSFHQPSSEVLSGNFAFEGLVNAYSVNDFHNTLYVSDTNRSGGFWKLWDSSLSQTESSVQLLIHPMWWMYSLEEPWQVWNQALVDAFRGAMHQVLETERAIDPESASRLFA